MVENIAEVAQLVEHQLPKLRVAGSNPVFRSVNQSVTVLVAGCFCFSECFYDTTFELLSTSTFRRLYNKQAYVKAIKNVLETSRNARFIEPSVA